MVWAYRLLVTGPEVDLTTDALLNGDPFVADGPDVRAQNKRYGMNVEFDTVANNFNISSGTTGEALLANSVVGVTAAQSASSIAIGRYALTADGIKDPTDTADYTFNKIGKGSNNVIGLPGMGLGVHRTDRLAWYPNQLLLWVGKR